MDEHIRVYGDQIPSAAGPVQEIIIELSGPETRPTQRNECALEHFTNNVSPRDLYQGTASSRARPEFTRVIKIEKESLPLCRRLARSSRFWSEAF